MVSRAMKAITVRESGAKDYSGGCAFCGKEGSLYNTPFCTCPLCAACVGGVVESCPYCNARTTLTDEEALAATRYEDEPDMSGWRLLWWPVVLIGLGIVFAVTR